MSITTNGTTGETVPQGGASIGVTASGAPANASPDTSTSTTHAAPGEWTTGFNDDAKGYVQTKGFKDAASVVDSYRNLEKAIGVPKERLLKLPEKADSPEWNDIYNRLGKPAKAEEYLISKMEGVDPSTAKWAEEVFYNANLSRTQADMIAKKWNELNAGKMAEHQAKTESQRALEVETLKKEWGMAYESKLNIADRAAEKFGLGETEMKALAQALGTSKALKLMADIGTGLGEDSFVSGGTSGAGKGPMTPAAAQHEIKNLMQDKDFYNKLMNKDTQALDRWNKLNQYALGNA